MIHARHLPQAATAQILRDPDTLPTQGPRQPAAFNCAQKLTKRFIPFLYGGISAFVQHGWKKDGHHVAPLTELHMNTLTTAGFFIREGQQTIFKPLASSVAAGKIMNAAFKAGRRRAFQTVFFPHSGTNCSNLKPVTDILFAGNSIPGLGLIRIIKLIHESSPMQDFLRRFAHIQAAHSVFFP